MQKNHIHSYLMAVGKKATCGSQCKMILGHCSVGKAGVQCIKMMFCLIDRVELVFTIL